MAEWTREQVAARFEDAADVAERLPSGRSLGYFNIWPTILKTSPGRLYDDHEVQITPSPESVDRMVETNRWALWLEEEQRHLVWMCAQRCKWKDIAVRFGCEKSTARRRWHRALNLVADHLNQASEK